MHWLKRDFFCWAIICTENYALQIILQPAAFQQGVRYACRLKTKSVSAADGKKGTFFASLYEDVYRVPESAKKRSLLIKKYKGICSRIIVKRRSRGADQCQSW